MFYILDGCEILHLHQKDARTLYNYITILNHYYPLHFLGTSSCPTQLLRFFNLLRPKGLGSTWDQLPRKSPKPTAKWGSDDLPLLAPIHALVDVAEKVHLKGLKKRGLINQALKYIPSEMNQIYQFWSGTTRLLFFLLGCGMKEMWEPLLVMTRNSSCLSELCQLCYHLSGIWELQKKITIKIHWFLGLGSAASGALGWWVVSIFSMDLQGKTIDFHFDGWYGSPM